MSWSIFEFDVYSMSICWMSTIEWDTAMHLSAYQIKINVIKWLNHPVNINVGVLF